jgi:hypothetical protein
MIFPLTNQSGNLPLIIVLMAVVITICFLITKSGKWSKVEPQPQNPTAKLDAELRKVEKLKAALEDAQKRNVEEHEMFKIALECFDNQNWKGATEALNRAIFLSKDFVKNNEALHKEVGLEASEFLVTEMNDKEKKYQSACQALIERIQVLEKLKKSNI